MFCGTIFHFFRIIIYKKLAHCFPKWLNHSEPMLYENSTYSASFSLTTSHVVLEVKNSLSNAGDVRDAGSILGGEDPLEKEMATHSSILAWRILQTEESGRLQSMGSHRFGHN